MVKRSDMAASLRIFYTPNLSLGILLLILVVGLAGCATLPMPDFSPARPHLSVVTYNVNWGCPNPQAVIEYLLSTDADVICLQETHRQWESTLRRQLGHRYPHAHFEEAGGAGGIAVMSKLPVQKVVRIEPTAGWFPALLAVVETPIGPTQILNVHLRPPLSDRGSATPSALYYSPEIHRQEIEGFLQSADRSAPLIIAGDFNENEEGDSLRHLLGNGFTDALSLYDRRSCTWFWRVAPGITLRNRYDHVFFSKRFTCTGARASPVDASDHMPVLAVLVRDEQGQ